MKFHERKDETVNVVETHGLTKRYGSFTAVDHFDMQVAEGDIYGFVGRNGAGKSTVMKMIAGLARPTEGDIRLFEHDQAEQGAQRLGVLIENPGLYPHQSAFENMMIKALALGLPDPKKTSNDLLAFVGLAGEASRKTKKFSMGMKQRLGLALALLGNPDLLLLDEPLNGLDPEGAREIRELIMRLNKERNMTVVISSHVLEQLGRMATRYGVIRRGNMVRQLSACEVEQECTDCLVLKTSDPNKALALLQERFANIPCKMAEDGAVLIYGALDTGPVGSSMAEAGLTVQELYVHKSDLEEYFVKMMGDESHV